MTRFLVDAHQGGPCPGPARPHGYRGPNRVVVDEPVGDDHHEDRGRDDGELLVVDVSCPNTVNTARGMNMITAGLGVRAPRMRTRCTGS